MRKVSVAFTILAAIVASASVSAQAQAPEAVQRSSSPSGIRVHGDGAAHAPAERGNAIPAIPVPATESSSMTATSPAKGAVKVQGNTRVDAHSRDLNAITTGKDSKAGNAVGTIGDR